MSSTVEHHGAFQGKDTIRTFPPARRGVTSVVAAVAAPPEAHVGVGMGRAKVFFPPRVQGRTVPGGTSGEPFPRARSVAHTSHGTPPRPRRQSSSFAFARLPACRSSRVAFVAEKMCVAHSPELRLRAGVVEGPELHAVDLRLRLGLGRHVAADDVVLVVLSGRSGGCGSATGPG